MLAQSPTESMLAANQLYEAGQFDEAAAAYQTLVDEGIQDSTVFYNLGNAHFKQADFGRAILNYRRAARLAPRDPDIRANLTLARAQTLDQMNVDGEALLSRLAELAQTWLTLNEMAVLALLLWILFALMLIIFTRLQAGRLKILTRNALLTVGVFLLAGIIFTGSRLYVEQTRPAGVIIAAEANVTSGPGEQYITEFTLHSGTEVRLIESRDNWVRLTLPGDNLQGWLPAETFGVVGIR